MTRTMPRIFLLLSLALGLGIALALPGAAPAADLDLSPDANLAPDPAIRIGTLENGLTFYIRQNAKPEARASLRLVVNAGSMLEDDDQRGLAHFLEHMAFNGTTNFEKNELVDYLERIGMRFGPDLNAYTSFDETVYMLEVPTDDAELLTRGMLVLGDWAQGITLDPEEVEKERGVVLDEWRRGLGASERIRQVQWPVLFKDSRYAQRLPIGKAEVIETAPAGRLADFYRDWYRTDLMAVIAIGDFDPDAVEAMIRENFGSMPAATNAPERVIYDVPPHEEVLAVSATDPEMPRTQVSILFKHGKVEEGSVGAYRRSMVESLFSSMFNARLGEIREKPDAPFLFAGSGSWSFARSVAMFGVFGVTREGEVERTLESLLTEVARVRAHGFGEGELERAKAAMLSGLENAYNERDKTENNAYAGEYVRNFLENEPIPGIEVEFELAKALFQQIDLAEVNHAIDRLVHEDNTVIMASGPEKDGVVMPSDSQLLAAAGAAVATVPDPYEDSLSGSALMTQLPEPGSIVKRSTDEALGTTTWTLSNGIEVTLKPTDYKNDEIIFSGQALGGTSLAPESDYTSASMATALVGEAGVGGFIPSELRKLTAGKNASGQTFIGGFTYGLSGSASPEDLETALQLAYLYWTAPNDREEAYEVLMDRIKSFIENRSVDPNAQFSDRVELINYNDHYTRQPPTLDMLEEVDRGKAMAFYRETFADASNLSIYFVGAIDLDAVEPLITRYLGSLPGKPGGRKDEFKDPKLSFPDGVITESVYAGTEPKSRTLITWPAQPTDDEMEMFYLRKANDALRIRLREIMREELGETYGVSMGVGTLYPYMDYKTTSVSFTSAPEHAAKLQEIVFQEVAKFKEGGPTEDEVAKVREQELRGLEKNEQQNRYWLSSFNTLDMLGWDLHRVLKRKERAESIAADKLHEAFRKNYPEGSHTAISLLPDGYAEGMPASDPPEED